MSTILQFRRVSKRTSRAVGEMARGRKTGSGEVIIFPGVRIERQDQLPDGTTPGRDARKRNQDQRQSQ
jgi:hypothetical protein